MKIHYYLMSMALAATALVGFTACNDDDYEPVYVVNPGQNGNIEFTQADLRVKIGEENRVAIPIANGVSGLRAFSMNPEIATIVEVNGTPMIEGLKNGTAQIMVSDSKGNYEPILVSVYTTEQLELNVTSLNFVTPLGISASNNECKVTLGNGGYSIASDNPKVSATITDEEGEISLVATSGADPYEATITVTDCTGLTADFTVNVEATFDGFTPEELDEIKALTENTLYASCKDPSDDTQPYYYFYYEYYGYGTWYDGDYDGTYRLGWWYNVYKGGYGGLSIEYPATAQVGEEVDGSLFFQYSFYAWYDLYTYDGTVKVLENDDTKTVAVFWNVDLENERINRGYFVKMK